MNKVQQEKIAEVIRLCNGKIEAQKQHEARSEGIVMHDVVTQDFGLLFSYSAGYGEDYTDGRIVGGAALARRILEILKSIPW
jgi:hypothetical protein